MARGKESAVSWLLIVSGMVLVACGSWLFGVACALWTSNQVSVAGVRVRIVVDDGHERPSAWKRIA